MSKESCLDLAKVIRTEFQDDAGYIEKIIGECSLAFSDVAIGIIEKIREKIVSTEYNDVESYTNCLKEILDIETFYSKLLAELKIKKNESKTEATNALNVA